jgi:alkylhydroperoxidase family enzyme
MAAPFACSITSCKARASVSPQTKRAALAWTEALTQLAGGVSDEVYAQASAEFSQRELVYLTSAIASINVWNRFGVAYRWTPPARQKTVGAAAS